jgi:hypothetical protein
VGLYRVNGKPFLSLQQFSTKKPESPKRSPENESKTGSKTVLLLSTALDKNGQNLVAPALQLDESASQQG